MVNVSAHLVPGLYSQQTGIQGQRVFEVWLEHPKHTQLLPMQSRE